MMLKQIISSTSHLASIDLAKEAANKQNTVPKVDLHFLPIVTTVTQFNTARVCLYKQTINIMQK